MEWGCGVEQNRLIIKIRREWREIRKELYIISMQVAHHAIFSSLSSTLLIPFRSSSEEGRPFCQQKSEVQSIMIRSLLGLSSVIVSQALS